MWFIDQSHCKQRIELAKRCGWVRQSSATITATQKKKKSEPNTSSLFSCHFYLHIYGPFAITCKMEGSGEELSICFTALECRTSGLLGVLISGLDAFCWRWALLKQGGGAWKWKTMKRARSSTTSWVYREAAIGSCKRWRGRGGGVCWKRWKRSAPRVQVENEGYHIIRN